MKHASYDIRPCGIGDLEAFRQVFQAAYDKPADAEYFRRKWNTGHTGQATVAHLAVTEDGRPVAWYGIYPQWLRKGDTRSLAAQAGDAATLPETRRSGLFRALAMAAEAKCEAHGIRTLIGFAQQQRGSFIGLVDMGWTHVADLTIHRWLTQVPMTMRLCRKLSRKTFARSMATRWNAVTVPHDAHGAVALDQSLVARTEGWHSERAPEYLRYKCTLGSRVVRLPSGHAWIAVQGNTARIGDLFGRDHVALLHELIALCRTLGVDVLEITTTADAIAAPLLSAIPADQSVQAGGLIVKPLPGSPCHVDEPLLFTGGDIDTF
ncbi:MAG: GNAT family N-acetyltransferase [Flavobacteriales bacterium]|nr:GNAT family N-acetyltransferase [Flavobacteriales bacterium]